MIRLIRHTGGLIAGVSIVAGMGSLGPAGFIFGVALGFAAWALVAGEF